MKKKFKLSDIDCASCAVKMEDAIRKIPGVEDANIGFMTQKLTLECDEKDMDRIIGEAQKAIDKVEPGTKIVR